MFIGTDRIDNLNVKIEICFLHLKQRQRHQCHQWDADALLSLCSVILHIVGKLQHPQVPNFSRFRIIGIECQFIEITKISPCRHTIRIYRSNQWTGNKILQFHNLFAYLVIFCFHKRDILFVFQVYINVVR